MRPEQSTAFRTFQNNFTVFLVFFTKCGCIGGSIGQGGGGGGTPPSNDEDANTSESSSECRVEKSKSHSWRERSHSLTNLSHCKSVSVFFDNISIAESDVGLFTTSFLDWDLASPEQQFTKRVLAPNAYVHYTKLAFYRTFHCFWYYSFHIIEGRCELGRRLFWTPQTRQLLC